MITSYTSLTVGKYEALLQARANHEKDTNELYLHVLSILSDMTIDQLLDLENPYACPHGRPTIISMSKYELEKKFKRIV